jgi:hypothetical protein
MVHLREARQRANPVFPQVEQQELCFSGVGWGIFFDIEGMFFGAYKINTAWKRSDEEDGPGPLGHSIKIQTERAV